MAIEMVAGIGGELIAREIPDRNKYSKLKAIKRALELGVWGMIKAKLEELGFYDLFLAAQYFDGSDPDFKNGIEMVKNLLGWSDEQVEDFLSHCVDNDLV